MARGRVIEHQALPVFLKTYIDRLTFSFTEYIRNEKDSSTELHQWIRRNYLSFRELGEFDLLEVVGARATWLSSRTSEPAGRRKRHR